MGNKNKTRKVATKRFLVTKTGKVKRKFAHTSHLARKDDSSARHRKKRTVNVTAAFAKKVKRMVIS
ncbi:hypothetical protein A2982_02565 [candidate division WWE3 bacterium RIFCSPLOWO2_01_FULL_39_13]|uniref:Large ribosomal subunit protein bL35 n=1 Tax=candidate division WWE3 bacterium RIFCSPLOWO2_01_FULL_39_13 TaxID=1802624 RepID=A0A1F4V3V3_UNCKA|nr:MAG: hypothetical protein A2982_02565 [candidate division WWE3 bacterium RIFCSPLOWO2_01_FULL_39_13]